MEPPQVAAVLDAAPNLSELWQDTLARLELPSTRMLLSQQAQLVRLDSQRAVVRVAGTWMAMVQSRLPLLEKALAGALGSRRLLVLEAGGESKATAASVPAPHAPPAQPEPEPAAVPLSVPAQAPARMEQPSAAPEPAPAMPSPLEEKVKRLAEFFNGEVIDDDVTDQVA